jgi:beta-glucosidase
LEGIAHQFSKAQVTYALGATYTPSTPALVPSTALTGLQAEYFNNPDLQGQPKLRRTESRVYFEFNMEDPAVLAAIGREKYSIRWTGTLTPTATGIYRLDVRAGFGRQTSRPRVFLDDKELDFTAAGRMTETQLHLEGGRKYALRVEYRQPAAGGGAQLAWIPPADVLLAEAEKIIRDSDVAILCVGLSADLEGEEMRGMNIPGFLGGDRTSLDLPEPQEKLLEAATATGKPVVVVLTSGSAISANYAAGHAAALLEAWYGGEEAGTAIADTLAGLNNPAGRLPVTFYKSVDQLPPFTDYAMKGRTYRYFKGEPLYPFGFGLSYSNFEYSSLNAKRTQKGAEIRATVKNTSARDGDEVVQLYVSGTTDEQAPLRSLRAFQRIHLRAGESRQLTFTLGSDDLPESKVEISVGGGQPVGNTPRVQGTL